MRLLLLVLPLLVGCGVLEGGTGCDFRDQDPGDARCQERLGTQATGFDAACEGLGDTVIEGGCDLTGAIAGCSTTIAGGTITDWYYAPETLETVTATCADDDAELVTP
ncbi:MAG: hypothetical protein Q8P18_12050 [Pseudomonadota bacterium]|nr:hypothetical protein [Pseudomonadota bacterium]